MSSFSTPTSLKRPTPKVDLEEISNSKKRRAMSTSIVLSDSGCSSMSPSASGNDSMCIPDVSAKKKGRSCPTLALLSKLEVIMNGRNRKRFPDPVHDSSILLACYDNEQNMLKIRHGKRSSSSPPTPGTPTAATTTTTTTNLIDSIFKIRSDMERVDDDFFISDDRCSFFLCLDAILAHDGDGLKKEVADNVMLADIRDHSVAGQCLPDGVTGYWVRFFGPKRKYTLMFSVWKNIVMEYKEAVHDSPHKHPHHHHHHHHGTPHKQHPQTPTKKVIKIGEKSIVVWNSGREGKAWKRKNKKKSLPGLGKMLKNHELFGSDTLPTFCTREKYYQILSSLRDSIENAKYDIFEELYEKFTCDLKDDDRDSLELKLLLWCEKSQFYAIQGKYPEAKKWLQKVVDNVVPKSPNKVFMLNRAYLLLASTHVQEGNNGTAEECLGIIQPDKKNGIPYEDVSLFHLLRGIIFMNFGKQLPRLSKFLWAESKQSFEASETNLKKSLPSMFHAYCRMHLNLARLLIYQSSRGSQLDYTAPEKRLKILESCGEEKLSLHIQCLFQIVRGEMLYHLQQIEKGDLLLTAAQQMAEKYSFREECALCEDIRRSWNEVQYKEFMDSLESDRLSKAVRNCMMMTPHTYSADESSM